MPQSLSREDLSVEERQRIESLLQEGELLKWVQKPRSSFLRGATIGFFLFALFWSSLSLLMAWQMLKNPVWWELLIIAPFILIGVVLLSLPFLHRGTQKRSLYIISNKRVLINCNFWPYRENRYWAIQAGLVQECICHKDGSGDLIFKQTIPSFHIKGAGEFKKNTKPRESDGLHDIPDAMEVQKLLSKLAKQN